MTAPLDVSAANLTLRRVNPYDEWYDVYEGDAEVGTVWYVKKNKQWWGMSSRTGQLVSGCKSAEEAGRKVAWAE